VISAAAILFFTQMMAILILVMGFLLLMLVLTASIPMTTTTAWLLIFGVLGLIVVLVVAALCIGTKLLLTSSIAVIEHHGTRKSLARSWQLTRSSFWRALGLLVVVNLCYSLCLVVPDALVFSVFQQPTLALIVRYSSLIVAIPMVSIA